MFFKSIELAPPDPFFGLQEAFLADERKNKIFLALGVYQNENGEKKPLECIQKAHEEIKHGQATYLGIDGVIITRIKRGSIAERADLQVGMEILQMNQKKIKSLADFNEALQKESNKKSILLLVRFHNMTRFVSIRVK